MSRKRRHHDPTARPNAPGPADDTGVPSPYDDPEGSWEQGDSEEDDDDEDPGPRAVIATVGDLGTWIPQSLRLRYADRPVWFLCEHDASLVGVFERMPEGAFAKAEGETILAALRAFSLDQNENLQWLLGVTEGIQYGFHVDASLDDVVESFEDDGFIVVPAVKDGAIALGEE